jgi:hypothetical protein
MAKRSARGNKAGSAEELASLAEFCRTIVGFLAELERDHPNAATSAMSSRMLSIIDAAVARRDLRGLKMVRSDMVEWGSSLSRDDVVKLDERLRSKLGRGLADEAETNRKRVEDVLKRGRIESDDEYDLLLKWMDEIHGDEKWKREVDAINELLAAHLPRSMS